MAEWISLAIAAISLFATIFIAKTAHNKTTEANRTAKHSAQEAARSADASEESATAAKEALRLQREQWDYERSALLCLDHMEALYDGIDTPEPGKVPGFVLFVRNRGMADAVDVFHALTIREEQSRARLMMESVARIRPDEVIQVIFEFETVDYSHHEWYQFVMEYRDFKQHRVVFDLRKQRRFFGAPRLTAAKLDGRPHPAHVNAHESPILFDID